MPDLLLELFSEEIPARMQAKAADDLRRMVTDKLVAEGLVYEGAKAFATPRRLALTVHGIPARQPDLKEERAGPRVGGPEAAIQGFLKATGLTSISEAKIQSDKKGDRYIALIEKPGRAAIDVLAEILPVIIRTFPWPKSMRWGARSAKSGSLVWVRPLHAIIATFGLETEDPDVVKFSVDGIEGGQTTYGHRFMAPAAINVRRLEDYQEKLLAAKVVLDPERRKDVILTDAKQLAFAQNLELVEDQTLLDEVAGLVEWPVVLMGTFDADFLSIPDEVIRATIRNNQKCFVVRDPRSGKLINKFIVTANIEASDGGKVIVAGNERVIRARLSDAKFFYETDLKTKLEDRLPKFEQIVFHEKLGTQGERIKRIERLAGEIAVVLWEQRATYFGGRLLDSDDFKDEQQYVRKVKRAARLAKADLLTEVVGEFPELQGLMGKYYALAQGEDASVAAASEEHYKPQGPNDRVPADPVSVAVALADKIDALVGFWAIDEKPTGRGDPYALRRAALGIVKIILDHQIQIDLRKTFSSALHGYFMQTISAVELTNFETGRQTSSLLWSVRLLGFVRVVETFLLSRHSQIDQKKLDKMLQGALLVPEERGNYKISKAVAERGKKLWSEFSSEIVSQVLKFFVERLTVQLRDQGTRHDLVAAVLALGIQERLFLVGHRAEALANFLDTEDGRSLFAGYKRAANILEIEEKASTKSFEGKVTKSRLKLEEEKALAKAIGEVKAEAGAAVAKEDFASAMSAMAKLRPAVDAFFEHVKVNDDDLKVRENRLKLLNEIRSATRAVADFSKIEG